MSDETPKIKPVCQTCGSAGVTHDAVVRFCDEAQEWEVTNIFDNADCDVCGGETHIEEVPLDQWQEAQGTDKWVEMPGLDYNVRAEVVGERTWKAEATHCYEDETLTDDRVFICDEEARDHARQLAVQKVFSR